MRGPVTDHDVEVVYTRLDREVSAGTPSGQGTLQLVKGNKAAGRAWRLLYNDEEPFLGLDNGFLGWSRREAYHALEGTLAGWLAATRYWGLQLTTALALDPNSTEYIGRRVQIITDRMVPPTEF